MTVVFRLGEKEYKIDREVVYKFSDYIKALIDPDEEIEPINLFEIFTEDNVLEGIHFLEEMYKFVKMIDDFDKFKIDLTLDNLLLQFKNFYPFPENPFIDWLSLSMIEPYYEKIFESINAIIQNPLEPKSGLKHSDIKTRSQFVVCPFIEDTIKFYNLCYNNKLDEAKWAVQFYKLRGDEKRFIKNLIYKNLPLELIIWASNSINYSLYDGSFFKEAFCFGNLEFLKYYIENFSSETHPRNFLACSIDALSRNTIINSVCKLDCIDYCYKNGLITEDVEEDCLDEFDNIYEQAISQTKDNEFIKWIISLEKLDVLQFNRIFRFKLENLVNYGIIPNLELIYPKCGLEFDFHEEFIVFIQKIEGEYKSAGLWAKSPINGPEPYFCRAIKWFMEKIPHEIVYRDLLDLLEMLITNRRSPYIFRWIYTVFYNPRFEESQILKASNKRLRDTIVSIIINERLMWVECPSNELLQWYDELVQ